MSLRTTSGSSEPESLDDALESKTLPRLMVGVIVMVALIYLTSDYDLYGGSEGAAPTGGPTGAFFLVLLIHAALYALGPRIRSNAPLVVPYFVIQSALVFGVGILTDNFPVVLLLYAAIIAEAVAILGGTKRVFGIAAFGALLFAINTAAVTGVRGALNVLLTLSSLGLLLYLINYARGAVAMRRIRALVRQLDESNHELAEYAGQVEGLTITNERHRMARELHDTLAQGLVGLTLQLEAADSHLTNGRAGKAHEIVMQTITRGREALSDARRAIYDLRSGDDSEGNLPQAIGEEIGRFKAASGMSCSLALSLEHPIPPATADNILRCIREGLTNVLRHAQANDASVTVAERHDHLEVVIRDDGVGFEPATIPAGHYGILGMHERTRTSGGTVDIESAPGSGTTLRMRFAVAAAEEIA